MNDGARSEAELIDIVSVSATWYCKDKRFLSERIRASATKIISPVDGSAAASIGTFRVENSNAQERQGEFENACSRLLTLLSDACIDPDFLRQTGSSVTLRITLEPNDGTAGIVLYPELLKPWMDLQADIDINAYPDA